MRNIRGDNVSYRGKGDVLSYYADRKLNESVSVAVNGRCLPVYTVNRSSWRD